MDIASVKLFMLGATTAAFAVIGIFFMRFYKDTKDRFFLIFALAFWVLAANRLAAVLLPSNGETPVTVYWIRFAAFALIGCAIIQKNYSSARRPPDSKGIG